MDFKIGPVTISGVQRYNEIARKPVKAVASSQETDKVDVSGSNRLFAQALAAAKSAPDIRAERVETVQQAVRNGTYQIDSGKIAERLLGLA